MAFVVCVTLGDVVLMAERGSRPSREEDEGGEKS
jgi:hypothetical protein